ncbi:MAG TPA: glycosyltransferase, partial [Armatimonadota bacterium]|nr:glycosyltransferase [Armatimonadota bacterium]
MAKIAIGIEDVNQHGGQERVVCELVRRLAGRHEIDLICYQAGDIPEDELNVIRLREKYRFSAFLRAQAFIGAASRQAQGGDYDAVLSQ